MKFLDMYKFFSKELFSEIENIYDKIVSYIVFCKMCCVRIMLVWIIVIVICILVFCEIESVLLVISCNRIIDIIYSYN